jgi:hypothetical protein
MFSPMADIQDQSKSNNIAEAEAGNILLVYSNTFPGRLIHGAALTRGKLFGSGQLQTSRAILDYIISTVINKRT